MKGQFRKVVAIVCAFALFVTGLTIQTKKVSADDYSALTYTQVGKKDYWVASGDDDFPFQTVQDQGEQFLIIPQVAAGTKPIWPDFTDATLNGQAFSQPAGAGIYIKYADLNDNAYNVFEATSAVDNHRFQIIIKAGTPVEGETTTPDPDATTVAPTTTELQKPQAPAGLVANINDLKTNFTIAFGNVATATSYKFYLDGEYKKDITNGGVVTIEELGLEAGKTYTFGVSAVNAAGESDISTVNVTVPSPEVPTTTKEGEIEEPTTAFDPSTITEWTKVTNSTTMSYYIADGAAGKVSVKPEMHGDNLYAAFSIAAKFKSVTLNGESIDPRDGADIEIAKTSFKEGYNKLEVTNYYGDDTVTIYFKVEKEEETTTKPYVDGASLVNEANVTKELPAYTGGDYWQSEYNTAPVTYVQGKKYVAEVVVSSTAAKKIKLVFQRVGIWDSVDADAGYEAEIAAGNKVKITYVFEATQGTDNGNFDIYLGSVADATTLVFESKKLTTYNEVPEGVTTGVEVLSAPQVPKATIDGTEVEVKDGKVTLGDAQYGYYCNGKMYKAGSEVEVTEDMAFTSVKELNITMAQGAGIRYIGDSGLRFQATITSDNMDAVASDAITEGTLITTSDIYNDGKDGELTLTYAKTKLNIVNSGWFNNQTGVYCGSVCKIAESNYKREFVARAYVTINYADGTSETTYSNNVAPSRSIQKVAQLLIEDNYGGISEEYHSVIDNFAK